jgi:hypothetical protein
VEGEALSESRRGGAGERGKGPQRTEHGFLIYDLFFHRFSLFFFKGEKRSNKVRSFAFRRSENKAPDRM